MPYDDWTALSKVAEWGRKDILLVLLDHGANAESINRAFVEAAATNGLEILHILLDRGADVNKVGSEALMEAASAGGEKGSERSDMVKVLLDLGVDVNAKSEEGWAALHHAAHFREYQRNKVLLDGGADINAKCECPDSTLDATALMIAARDGHSEVVEILLGREAPM